MILTGPKIQEEVNKGIITINPFNSDQLNPNSYDFRLGDTLKIYVNKTLDTRQPNETKTITISKEGFILRPDTLYLGHTQEIFGSDFYVPIVRGKSSTGRVGLFIHITADLIDIGYHGQYTLMLHSVQPVKVYPGMKIGQVTFWKTFGDIVLYKGKYQGSQGPSESQVYKDFFQENKKDVKKAINKDQISTTRRIFYSFMNRNSIRTSKK
ncbi:MAG: Nucleotide-phosphate interconversion protein [Candidatus Woesebacteria bacterium GW2011_GWB1_39_10]|uniref:Nucleotide-phosphate interconversion protein n=1 Tax=Candidatus Woesebacteria bacterium GW2011_GWB1_39_10 TaxID=1618572 RepID=A0A0G0LTR5_9BACT|nr:MAG: Nucleotide-phosphate interconversion protein [Candidatus Woesebacteria bacterium GW2011_GWB1_39_10]